MPLRFVQHLVARGLLAEAQAREVLHRQASVGGAADSAVLEQGRVAASGTAAELRADAGLEAAYLGAA